MSIMHTTIPGFYAQSNPVGHGELVLHGVESNDSQQRLLLDPSSSLLTAEDKPHPKTYQSTPIQIAQNAQNKELPLHQAPARPAAETNSSSSRIGVIYSTNNPRKYLFKCSYARCGKTFNRSYDFDRHYNGAHAVEKTVYWCPEMGCNRSESVGNQPFPRNDKMMDHVRKRHVTGNRTLGT